MTLASTLTNNTKTQTTATPSKKREWSSPQVRTAGNQSQHRQYILLFLFLSSWKMCEKPFSWSKVGIQEIPSVFACTFSTFSKHMPQCTLILLCCSGSPIPLPKHLASFAYTHPFLSPFFLLLSFFFDPPWSCVTPLWANPVFSPLSSVSPHSIVLHPHWSWLQSIPKLWRGGIICSLGREDQSTPSSSEKISKIYQIHAWGCSWLLAQDFPTFRKYSELAILWPSYLSFLANYE